MASLVENANRIQTDKEAIRQAIIAKGVEVAENVSLDDYAGLIEGISAGEIELVKWGKDSLGNTTLSVSYTATKAGKILLSASAVIYASSVYPSVKVLKNGSDVVADIYCDIADGAVHPSYSQYLIEVSEGDVVSLSITNSSSTRVMPYMYSIYSLA